MSEDHPCARHSRCTLRSTTTWQPDNARGGAKTVSSTSGNHLDRSCTTFQGPLLLDDNQTHSRGPPPRLCIRPADHSGRPAFPRRLAAPLHPPGLPISNLSLSLIDA